MGKVDEQVNGKIDQVIKGLNLANDYQKLGKHDDAIECFLGAQIAMQGAILARLTQTTDLLKEIGSVLEDIQVTVNRFDSVARDGRFG